MREERRISTSGLQLRKKASGPGTATGHAATFNQRYAIGDPRSWGFWEVVAPGAFRAALERPDDVFALWHHDSAQILGRLRSGTLRLVEDAVGLAVENDLPDTSLGRDAAVLMDRGDVSAMSFGFLTKSDRWDENPDGTTTRTILDVELFDVSPVSFPANPNTDIALRSATSALLDRRRATFEAEWRERRLRLLSIEP